MHEVGMHEQVCDELVRFKIGTGDITKRKQVTQVRKIKIFIGKASKKNQTINDEQIFYYQRKNFKAAWAKLIHTNL